MEAPLATVSRDGPRRVVRRQECCDRGGANTPCPRFIGELLFPCLKACRGPAALCGARLAGHPHHERHQGCDGDCLELALCHSELLSPDIHRMTALLRPRLPVSTDFSNANSSARGSRAPKPVTFTRRAPKMWILLSSRRTSPLVFDGKTIKRFTSMRLPAAAAVPRSAAGCQRINAVR